MDATCFQNHKFILLLFDHILFLCRNSTIVLWGKLKIHRDQLRRLCTFPQLMNTSTFISLNKSACV